MENAGDGRFSHLAMVSKKLFGKFTGLEAKVARRLRRPATSLLVLVLYCRP